MSTDPPPWSSSTTATRSRTVTRSSFRPTLPSTSTAASWNPGPGALLPSSRTGPPTRPVIDYCTGVQYIHPRMQGWLFGHDAPRCDAAFSRLEHTDLGGEAWVDYQRDWLEGHARLFDELYRTVAWREEDRKMYDRVVAVPR